MRNISKSLLIFFLRFIVFDKGVHSSCPKINQSVYHGYIDQPQNANSGDEAKVICEHPYVISNKRQNISIVTCQNDGTWNGEIPNCKPKPTKNLVYSFKPRKNHSMKGTVLKQIPVAYASAAGECGAECWQDIRCLLFNLIFANTSKVTCQMLDIPFGEIITNPFATLYDFYDPGFCATYLAEKAALPDNTHWNFSNATVHLAQNGSTAVLECDVGWLKSGSRASPQIRCSTGLWIGDENIAAICVPEPTEWEKARDTCQSKESNFIVARSEDTWLTFQQYRLDSLNESKSEFKNIWLGLWYNKEQRRYQWADDIALKFTHWMPDKFRTTVMEKGYPTPEAASDEDHCVASKQADNFDWTFQSCDSTEFDGICSGGQVLLISTTEISGNNNMEIYDINHPENSRIINISLSGTRSAHVSGVFDDGTVVIAGGMKNGVCTPDTEFYDQRLNKVTPGPNMNEVRAGAAAAMLNNAMIVCGGWDCKYGLDMCEKLAFNKTLGQFQWSSFQPKGHGLTDHAMIEFENNLFAIGGYVGGIGCKNRTHQYNSATNQWTLMAPMLTSRAGHSAAVLNGFIYVCGGCFSSTSNTCEKYNPSTNEWVSVVPGDYHSNLISYNGKLYAFSKGDERMVQAYIPYSDTWTNVTQPIQSRRSGSTVVFLKQFFVN